MWRRREYEQVRRDEWKFGFYIWRFFLHYLIGFFQIGAFSVWFDRKNPLFSPSIWLVVFLSLSLPILWCDRLNSGHDFFFSLLLERDFLVRDGMKTKFPLWLRCWAIKHEKSLSSSSFLLLLLRHSRKRKKKSPGNTSFYSTLVEGGDARRTREKLEREMTLSLSL